MQYHKAMITDVSTLLLLLLFHVDIYQDVYKQDKPYKNQARCHNWHPIRGMNDVIY